jgi:hypothetical protein
MQQRPFQEVASIQLTDASGEIHTASALIHQDPQYLHANRISLIGTRDKEIELLGFGQNGVVDWQFHIRPDWKLNDDPDYAHIQRGSGILRPTGMTHGVMIADESIQPYAEIEIIEATDELRSKGLKGPEAEYWFLQRPKDDWYVRRRSWRKPEPIKLTGPWVKISPLGLRFRLLRIAIYRDDERIASERERIEVPGVEIQPVASMEDEAFFFAADRLWFAFRVLLTFRYRQFVHTFVEFTVREQIHKTTWHTIRLEPRIRRRWHEAHDPPFWGELERYLARGAARLTQLELQSELLHAAAFGYASSYTTYTTESGLTACVEGIERLVEAYEQVNGLTRERVGRSRWRKLGRAMRQKARTVEATPDEIEAIESSLSDAPKLRLLERIERMTRSLRPKWRKIPLELLEGATDMIKARNDIVHGRLVADANKLYIERLRAQSMFERLWLGFFDCGDLETSGWPLYTIRHHMPDQATPPQTA